MTYSDKVIALAKKKPSWWRVEAELSFAEAFMLMQKDKNLSDEQVIGILEISQQHLIQIKEAGAELSLDNMVWIAHKFGKKLKITFEDQD